MKLVEGILSSALAAPGTPMPPPPMYPPPMPPPGMYPPPMPPPPQKSGMGTVAGVMYILGAVFLIITLIGGILVAAVGTMVGGVLESSEVDQYVAYLWGVCVVLPLLGMIFGILGAVFVFQRKKFTIAMVGGVMGMVAGILSGVLIVGPIVVPNWVSILAFIFFLIGLIMQMVVKKEFT